MYFKRAALGCGSTVAHAINCVRPLCGRRSGTISGYFWASCAGHAAHWAQAQGNHPLGRSSCAKEARPTAEQPIARPAADMCEQTRRLSAGGDELSPRPSRPPSLGLAARRGMRAFTLAVPFLHVCHKPSCLSGGSARAWKLGRSAQRTIVAGVILKCAAN